MTMLERERRERKTWKNGSSNSPTGEPSGVCVCVCVCVRERKFVYVCQIWPPPSFRVYQPGSSYSEAVCCTTDTTADTIIARSVYTQEKSYNSQKHSHTLSAGVWQRSSLYTTALGATGQSGLTRNRSRSRTSFSRVSASLTPVACSWRVSVRTWDTSSDS